MSRRAWWWLGVVVLLVILVVGGASLWRPTLAPEPGPGSKRPLQIGAVLPQNGPPAQIGAFQKKGIDLAVEQINGQGGIGGAPLQVVYEDSQGDPTKGLSALRKILAVSRVPAVFLSTSGVASAALPDLGDKQVAGLLLAVSLPGITERSPWAFRCNLGSDDEARAMAAHLASTPLRRIAVAYLDDEFGVGAEKVFQEEARRRGIHVTGSEAYSKDGTDFRTLVEKLRRDRPDAWYVIGFVRSSVNLIQQLRELGVKAPVLGNMALSVPSFLEQGGEALEGATFTATEFDPGSSRPQTKAFVDAYRQKYGETPAFFAGFAYDATRLLALAMEKKGTSADEIRQGLAGIQGYEGVMGSLSVLPNRDIEFPTRVVRNERGTLVPVSSSSR